MKKLDYLLLSFVLVTNLYSQDSIKDYPGIPILTYLGDNFRWHTNPLLYKQMDSVGIFGTEVGNMKDDYYPFIEGANLKVLPNQIDGVEYNYINQYTDAYYSVWEAEDTNSVNGDANLSYKKNVGEIYNNAVRTKINQGIANDTLIYGPYYMQEVKYVMVQNDVRIPYTVEFKLKKETIGQPPNPNDIICVLQATTSHVTDTWPFHIDTTKVLDSLVVRYSELADTFKTFNLNYNYLTVDTLFTTDTTKFRAFANYVQFKVLWKGNSNKVRLYVDKIILSDQRGRDLKAGLATPEIIAQINSDFSSSYSNRVIGWMGIDEPLCIDQFEPIRVVQNIVDTYGQGKGLWLATGTNYNGRFGGNVPVGEINPLGSYKLKTFDEFYKRVGKANLWSDYYLYVNDDGTYGNDFKEKRIMYMADTVWGQFKNKENIFWGASIPTGYYGDSSISWIGMRETDSKDFLYNVNIALLCGAKVLSLWTYFANIDIGQPVKRTALVNAYFPTLDHSVPPNSYEYTNKWHTLKDTIAPRLSGLMGKTLKKLTPTNQVLKIPLNTQFSFSNFIEKVIRGACTAQGSQSGDYDYDLGFFTDSLSRDYFMLISRCYNGGCDPALTIKLKPEYYNNYNIKVVDFINNQTYNTNRFGSISTALVRGDAGFFGVFHVLTYGGSITANDTTYNNETLLSDLSIESGATLTINGTYNAKANITVKSGGKIVAGTNGKIIFDPYKKLIVEGITEIKGQSNSNRLTLQYLNSEKGIELTPGSSFTLQYCNLSGALYGISSVTSGSYYVNISNSTISSGSTGIALTGNLQGTGLGGTPTSTINNCNFPTSGTGISISNYNSILIKDNTFTGSGIYISNVPSAFIQSNNISLGSSTSQSGIFFNNSGGYIRNNTIKNRVNGIQIANSSPDVGGNFIENNYNHGLYIGGSSIPNLVGLIQTNPPTYYPLAGYNTIRNNGSDTRSGGNNDGSEIYFSRSNARLGIYINPGCNQIIDDRTSTSTMSTVLLLGGTYSNGTNPLSAVYNYWGIATPTNSRFSCTTYYQPYNAQPCTINGGSSSEKFVLKTSTGEIVDSISASEGAPESLTEIDISYSEADNLFATGNVTQSKPLYEQIVTGNYTSEEKLSAYNKLYAIGNLTGNDETYFTSLQNAFEDIANNEADTLIKKVYEQNAIKCDVSKEEYITAINKFVNIIQQNPNSEEAVYAEIDIITTALYLDTTNPGLGKIGSKYLVKGTSDYLSKLNDILQSKFGVNSEESKNIIPKEYSLHQNYPNPFNPVTTIKFDIPDVGTGLALSNVTLKVYDILGKEVATLVNEQKVAGKYEVNFNASALASGVYVYKLQASDFTSSKKMILLK